MLRGFQVGEVLLLSIMKINGLLDTFRETDAFGMKTAEEVADDTYYVTS